MMSLINKLTGHYLIIIKQPECFRKSDEHPKSMNKLTVNETSQLSLKSH